MLKHSPKHSPTPQSLHQKHVSFLFSISMQHTAHLFLGFAFFSVLGILSIKCLAGSLSGSGVFEGRPCRGDSIVLLRVSKIYFMSCNLNENLSRVLNLYLLYGQ
jgi:hypothetical protein